jgi:hypothetical protein
MANDGGGKRPWRRPRPREPQDDKNTAIRNSSWSPPPTPLTSSSFSLLWILLPIILFFFVGLPLIVFVWYLIQNQRHVEREVGLAVGVTLVLGALMALLLWKFPSTTIVGPFLHKLFQERDEISIKKQQEQETQEKIDPSDSNKQEEEEEEEWKQPKVCFQKEDAGDVTLILTEHQRQVLAEHVLPRSLADHTWRCLYSLARDGDAFDTCLRKLQNERRTLIVMKTSHGAILGGYADAEWISCTKGIVRKDQGGAGARVFCFHNIKDTTHTTKDLSSVYTWTGANRYTQLVDVERQRLAMGAASGGDLGDFDSYSYAWSAERNFTMGTTGRCPTFDNEPLCEQERFDIVDLEIYGFSILG